MAGEKENLGSKIEDQNEELENREMDWKEKALEAISILKTMSKPPLMYATFLGFRTESKTAEVTTSDGNMHIVNYDPRLEKVLSPGDTVNLDPKSLVLVKKDEQQIKNKAQTTISDILSDGRVQIEADNKKRIITTAIQGLKVGDNVLTDNSYSIVLENLGNNSRSAYKLDRVPNVPWSSVGGLESTIKEIKKQIETPLVHKEIYDKFPDKKPIKGALLYGPPGCGKTHLAKAIAYNMALQRKEKFGGELNGFFMNVSGPEFLQKYVGVGESKIRELFAQARETAMEHNGQVVIFIDEGETVFRKRGTGISSDATDTLVQEFLYQMDGMKSNDNLLILLASNRPEMLDSAIIRPGRVDRKIYVGRPDQVGAEQIFNIYLRNQPLNFEKGGFLTKTQDPSTVLRDYSGFVTSQIYNQNLPMLDIYFKNGDRTQLQFKHVFSGATAVSIVGRATDFAIDRGVNGGNYKLQKEDLREAVMAEYLENKDLTNLVTDFDIKTVANGRHNDIVEVQKASYK